MANCLVAQSGGPTTVINASLAGVVRANQLNPVYDHVYGGLNGIEGILEDRLYDLTNMSEYENRLLGRDAGWLAGSTVVTGRVDLIVLPEVDFDKEKFLAQVKKCMDEKGKCYIVTSEGAHYADGTYIAAGEAVNDGFGHAVLGGAGENLKNMILEAGIAPRAKVQDLSTAARSSNFAQSLVDVTEAFELGMSAHSRSADGKFTGHVVAVQREYVDGRYNAKFISGPAENFANHVKHVPVEWILPDYQGLTQEFYDYITPLIQGEPTLIMENGIPKTIVPFNKR